MRIEPRDNFGRRLPRFEVDERARPARVQSASGSPDIFLRWDESIDDAGALRRCVLCSCNDLYVRKNMPRLTPFVVVLAFCGSTVALLGYATNPLIYGVLATVLLVDILTLVLATRQLVCYGCGAVYTALLIARYHHRWERTVAERVVRGEVDFPTALIASAPTETEQRTA